MTAAFSFRPDQTINVLVVNTPRGERGSSVNRPGVICISFFVLFAGPSAPRDCIADGLQAHLTIDRAKGPEDFLELREDP